MKEERDYIRDISEIRSIMERSTKFMSLSGWAGILAGIYALAGAYVAWKVLDFNPVSLDYHYTGSYNNLLLLSLLILFIAIASAVIDSSRKANSRKEKAWNKTSRRLLINMAVPLLSGGTLILFLIFSGLAGLAAPLTLIFYGLALYNAGNFTFKELRIMGIAQIILGIVNCFFVSFGLIFWIIGFGLIHIIYGIYMHIKYRQ